MTNNCNPYSDLDLAQHIEALCQEHTEGPPPQTVTATLALLREHSVKISNVEPASRWPWSIVERLVQMTRQTQIATAVMVTVGAALLYGMYTLFSTFGATVAFADVAAKFRAARTMTYVLTTTVPGQGHAVSIKEFLADPDRMRTEMENGTVMIVDGNGSMFLDSRLHTARRIELSPTSLLNASLAKARATVEAYKKAHGRPKSRPAAPEAVPFSMVQMFKHIADGKGDPAGEKLIDGVATSGFRIKFGQQDATIWADSKTAMPVRIEMNLAAGTVNTLAVMDHFVFDPSLDDSLFSMDTPPGYTEEASAEKIPTTQMIKP